MPVSPAEFKRARLKTTLGSNQGAQSNMLSRFTEGRMTIKMRLRNLTFHRKRSYNRKDKWAT